MSAYDFFNVDDDEEEYDEEEIPEELEMYMFNSDKANEQKEPNIDLLTLSEQKQQAAKEDKKRKMKEKKKKKKEKQVKPQIEYSSEVAPNETKTQQVTSVLSNVRFELPVKQCIKMNFEKVRKTKVQYFTLNEKWIEKYDKMMENTWKLSKNGINSEDKVIKRIVDEEGNPIPKLIFKEATTAPNIFSKRCNYASAVIGKKIFIHGGRDVKSTFDDLISLDTETMTWTVYKGFHRLKLKLAETLRIPALSDHQMVAVNNNSLLIFGAEQKLRQVRRRYYNWGPQMSFYTNEMQIYYISNVTNPQTMHYGIKTNIQGSGFLEHNYAHPERVVVGSSFLSVRKQFTVSEIMGYFFIFGGRISSSQRGFDDLFVIEIKSPKLYIDSVRKPSIGKGNFWPRGRYGHCAGVANGELYIHGGHDGDTNLSDLWVYSFTTPTSGKWKEIEVHGTIPPPLYQHSMFVLSNKTLCIYGGVIGSTVSNILFRFDIGRNQWYVVKVMGHGKSETSSAKELQLPLKGHSSFVISDQLFIIGGNNGKFCVDNLTILNDVKEPGDEYMLTSYLAKQKEKGFMCDVTFFIKDEELDKIVELKAHKCVVACRCPHLAKLVENSDKVNITECGYDAFYAYIHFLYTGQIILEGENNIKQLLEIANKWNPRAYNHISKICSTNVSLDTAHEIIRELEQDLAKLVNSSLHSDVLLKLGEDENLPAHKVIICRSPFFTSMLESGMKESITNEVDLESIDIDAMLQILKFLYTDIVEVTPQTCVGVLIYSLMFGIVQLAANCRLMVEQNLNPSHAIQIYEVGDLYQDIVLKRIALDYIKKNWEECRNQPHMDKIDEKLKQEITFAVEKYKAKLDRRKKKK